jgi:poly-gamma-glutamate synthesis protein (capsule biosynthesis protein)
MGRVNLLFSGDFAPVGRVESICNNNEESLIFNNISKLLSGADLHITNLESPLTDSNVLSNKTGPHLKASPKTINALIAAKVSIACMANNHILDMGPVGIMNSIDICHQVNIDIVGAGSNSENAAEILYKNINGKTLAFLNVCENEFSVSNVNEAGANGLDLIRIFKDITEAKKKASHVMLIYHGGHEYYNLPSPRIQKLLRFFADSGASCIICHHSHVTSGYEIHKNVPIFYGLGNFLFDDADSPDDLNWHTGQLVQLTIEETGEIKFEIHYVRVDNSTLEFVAISTEERSNIEKSINSLCSIINDMELLERAWLRFAKSHEENMVKNFLNLNILQRILCKLGVPLSTFLNPGKILAQLNYIKCESHRDLLLHSLNQKI